MNPFRLDLLPMLILSPNFQARMAAAQGQTTQLKHSTLFSSLEISLMQISPAMSNLLEQSWDAREHL